MPRQRASRAQRADRGRVTRRQPRGRRGPSTGSDPSPARPGDPRPEVRPGRTTPMSVRRRARGRYSCPVTRPTPRTPLLAVRRSTSALTVGAAVAGALALVRLPGHLPSADDGALPAGRRRERHPRRRQGQRPRGRHERQGQGGVLSGQVINNGPRRNRHLRRSRRRAAADHEVAARSSAGLSGEAGVSPVTLPTGVGRAGLDARPDHRDERRRHRPGRGVPCCCPTCTTPRITPAAPSASATDEVGVADGPPRDGAGALARAGTRPVRLRRPRTCSPARAP